MDTGRSVGMTENNGHIFHLQPYVLFPKVHDFTLSAEI